MLFRSPFFGTHNNYTLFWHSPGLFFDTRTDSTFSGDAPGFYHFSVLTLIPDFFGTRPECFSILARILPFPSTRPDSTFSGVLARILPFFGTHIDSTFFRYSLGLLFDTRTVSTFLGYSPGFYHFSVTTLIRPFFDSRPECFSILTRILPFSAYAPIFLPIFGTHND